MRRVCLLTLVLLCVPAALAFGPLWVRVGSLTDAAGIAAPAAKCICGDRSRDGSGCICPNAGACATMCKGTCGEKCPVPCPAECQSKCDGPCDDKCRDECGKSCPRAGNCAGRGQGCKRAA